MMISPTGSIFQPSDTRPNYTPVHYSPKVNSSGRSQKLKLSKSDIGTPNNFKHVTHVGFSSMSEINLDSDVDMKALMSLAGIHENHIDDKERSCRIFDVLKNEDTIEHVQKMTRRMTSVERPNTRTRLRSRSSSNITPTKRKKSPTGQSPCVAKLTAALPDHTPFNYIQSLSKVPASYSAPSLNHIPSMKLPPSMPPYLKELSRTLACNPSIHPQSKDVPVLPPHPQSKEKPVLPPHPQFHYGRNSKNITSHPTSSSNKTSPSMAINSTAPFNPTNTATESSLQAQHSLLQLEKLNASPSVPSDESSIMKYGDVPPLPACPFAKGITETNIPPLPCSKPLLSTEFAHGIVPPAPLPFKLQSGSDQTLQSSNEHVLCKSLDPSLDSQPEHSNHDTASEELVVSSKFHGQPNEQTFFLDQIRQGVQLKSVSQNLKAASSKCTGIDSALRAVIQKRHKAIHSSDEEDNEEEEEEWED